MDLQGNWSLSSQIASAAFFLSVAFLDSFNLDEKLCSLIPLTVSKINLCSCCDDYLRAVKTDEWELLGRFNGMFVSQGGRIGWCLC